jgi:hypothetical protein
MSMITRSVLPQEAVATIERNIDTGGARLGEPGDLLRQYTGNPGHPGFPSAAESSIPFQVISG